MVAALVAVPKTLFAKARDKGWIVLRQGRVRHARFFGKIIGQRTALVVWDDIDDPKNSKTPEERKLIFQSDFAKKVVGQDITDQDWARRNRVRKTWGHSRSFGRVFGPHLPPKSPAEIMRDLHRALKEQGWTNTSSGDGSE